MNKNNENGNNKTSVMFPLTISVKDNDVLGEMIKAEEDNGHDFNRQDVVRALMRSHPRFKAAKKKIQERVSVIS